MSRLAAAFRALDGRPALIPFLMAGDPDLPVSGRLLRAAAAVGDIVEVGVPFSDPIADGPTIQRAGQRALEHGTSLANVLALVGDLYLDRPTVLLTYLNPVFQYGYDRFCADARAAGVDGVIIPDLPADEAAPLIGPAREAGLDTIFLVAPTSSDGRLRAAGTQSTGYIYAVSLTGVTGARTQVPPEVGDLVRRVRAATALPVCVGFGISTPDQAAAIGRIADGVIVGSALVSVVERWGSASEEPLVALLRSLEAALV